MNCFSVDWTFSVYVRSLTFAPEKREKGFFMDSASTRDEVLSQRGQPKIKHDGHLYVKEKRSKDGETQFWRCQYVGECKARLHTSVATGEVVKTVNEHSDEPDPAGIDIAARRMELKRRATDTQETPLQLIEKVFETSSQATKLVLPSCETLSRSVNRARKKAARSPAIPTNCASIVVPTEFIMYESEPGRSEKFLIGDTGKFSTHIVNVMISREKVIIEYCIA